MDSRMPLDRCKLGEQFLTYFRRLAKALTISGYLLQSVKVLVLLLFLTASSFAIGADEPAPPEARPTPPRLSFIDGQASFWRVGADDWTPARINMPLASGDALYTADRSNLEIQVATRVFVRAAPNSQIGLVNVEPDFLQFELKGGTASLDLRNVPPSYSYEIDTPNAVFTIENPVYYYR